MEAKEEAKGKVMEEEATRALPQAIVAAVAAAPKRGPMTAIAALAIAASPTMLQEQDLPRL